MSQYPERVTKALQRAEANLKNNMPNEALPDIETALKKVPKGFHPWFLLGQAKAMMGDYDAAEPAFKKALQIMPNNPEAWFNLGITYSTRNRFAEAAQYYTKAINNRKQDFYVDAALNLGSCHLELGQYKMAQDIYHYILKLGENANIHFLLGVAYQGDDDYPKAIQAYQRAMELGLNPNYTLYLNLGTCYHVLGDYAQASEFARRALAMQPNDDIAAFNLGSSLVEDGKIEEAIQCFGESNYPPAQSSRLFAFNLLMPYSKERLLEAHQAWGEKTVELALPLPTLMPDRTENRPLKIGFVSADFHEHPVAYFFERLVEHIDREKFTLHFYADIRVSDTVTERFQRAADSWTPIFDMADQDIAEAIQNDAIDILFDLSGHTSHRITLFAARIAPVQVSYLGYPATSGLPTMDYFLTDAVLDPVGESDDHYTEKLCRLGRSFVTYTPPTVDVMVAELPMQGKGYPTFASFNRISKLSQVTLQMWAQALTAVPDARLVIMAKGMQQEATQQRFRDKLGMLGVDASRIEFYGAAKMEEYLAFHNKVDLILDCVPWTGHTISMHGLWMGVPTVTVAGHHHAGRFGELVMRGVGLNQFVAPSVADYGNTVAAIIADKNQLSEIRQNLRTRLASSLLCDHVGLAKNFEMACRLMWHNYLQEKVEAITI